MKKYQQRNRQLFLLLLPIVAESLTTLNFFQRRHPNFLLWMVAEDGHGESTQQLLDSLRSLRVIELKSDLESRGISTRDVFEKEELVQRLYTAKTCDTSENNNSSSTKKKKKRRRYDDDGGDDVMTETINETNDDIRDDDDVATTVPQSTPDNIIVPFQYFSLEASKSVAAKNLQDIYIRPSEGKYAAIKVIFKNTQSSTSDAAVSLNLLVDTACSGLVISPSAVNRVNGECPGIFDMQTVGATMSTAGGSQSTGVVRWNISTNMIVGDVVVSPVANGSMPNNVAACQDIGALPSGLDGIIGLSFLNQFSTVDFDFANGQLRLFKKDMELPLPNNNNSQLSLVAQGRLTLTRLGIYTTPTNLDGRGPVNMLVDTGAASSFLNWNGVSQLNLSRDSPLVNPIVGAIGAIGKYNC